MVQWKIWPNIAPSAFRTWRLGWGGRRSWWWRRSPPPRCQEGEWRRSCSVSRAGTLGRSCSLNSCRCGGWNYPRGSSFVPVRSGPPTCRIRSKDHHCIRTVEEKIRNNNYVHIGTYLPNFSPWMTANTFVMNQPAKQAAPGPRHCNSLRLWSSLSCRRVQHRFFPPNCCSPSSQFYLKGKKNSCSPLMGWWVVGCEVKSLPVVFLQMQIRLLVHGALELPSLLK